MLRTFVAVVAWVVFSSCANEPGIADARASRSPESDVGCPCALQRLEIDADDGHRIVVWGRAPPSPRAVVLWIHGRTWSARPDFDLHAPDATTSTLAQLAARGIAAYAIDLRGYGDTPRDSSGWITPHRATLDLAATLEVLILRHPEQPRPVAAGWSLGALSAHRVAVLRPDLVSGIVLYGHPRPVGHHHTRGEDEELDARPRQQPTTAADARADFQTAGAVDPWVVDAFVEAALERDPVKADWRRMSEFDDIDLSAFRGPILFIQGEHDPYAPLEQQSDWMVNSRGRSRAWVVLPNADHAAHLENARDAFVEAVAAFILAATRSAGADPRT